jgi:putative transposase
MPRGKEKIVGGGFWSDGYYVSTVGKHGNEGMVKKYVEAQGKAYSVLHINNQLLLF